MGVRTDSTLTPPSRVGFAGLVYRGDVSSMPEPGDLIEAFSPQPGRCFRMVQSR